MKETCAIEVVGACVTIRCFACGMRSYNANDVANKYCGHCHQFHPIQPKPRKTVLPIAKTLMETEKVADPEERKQVIASLLHSAFLKEEAANVSLLRRSLMLLRDQDPSPPIERWQQIADMIREFNVKFPNQNIPIVYARPKSGREKSDPR